MKESGMVFKNTGKTGNSPKGDLSSKTRRGNQAEQQQGKSFQTSELSSSSGITIYETAVRPAVNVTNQDDNVETQKQTNQNRISTSSEEINTSDEMIEVVSQINNVEIM